MVKKTTKPDQTLKSTSQEFIESLSPTELEQFNIGYRKLVFSELRIAIKECDESSVQKLVKILVSQKSK